MATSRFKAITPKLRTEDLTSPPPPLAQPQSGAWDLDASWNEIAKNRPAPVPTPPGLGEQALGYLKQGLAAFQEPQTPEFYSDFSKAEGLGRPADTTSQQLSVTPAPQPSPRDTLPFGADELIGVAAKETGLDPLLLQSLIEQESSFNPSAVSKKGAMGLTQLMPQTAEAQGVKSPFSTGENILAGARVLKQELDRFGGDLPKALAAYNAGATAVSAYKGVPPFNETQNYVKEVMRRYQRMQATPQPTSQGPPVASPVSRPVAPAPSTTLQGPPGLTEPNPFKRALAGGIHGAKSTFTQAFAPISEGGTKDIGARVGEIVSLPFSVPFSAAMNALIESGALSPRSAEEIGKIFIASMPAIMGPEGAAARASTRMIRQEPGAAMRAMRPVTAWDRVMSTPEGQNWTSRIAGLSETMARGGTASERQAAATVLDGVLSRLGLTREDIPAGIRVQPERLASAGEIPSRVRMEDPVAPDVDWNTPGPPRPAPSTAPIAPPTVPPVAATPASAETVTPPWTNISFPKVAPEVVAPKTGVPLAPPAVPGVPADLRAPTPTPVAPPPVPTDPRAATDAISGLVNLGFSKKDATVLVTQAVSENPTADFETLIRAAMGKTNAPKAVAPQMRPPVPPPLAVAPVGEPAPVEAVPVPEIVPEPVVTPEIPPVAAQEAIPGTIAAEPVVEALPTQTEWDKVTNIAPFGGGYQGWIQSDQGTQIEMTGVQVNPQLARERMLDDTQINFDRFAKAWGERSGYTFEKAKAARNALLESRTPPPAQPGPMEPPAPAQGEYYGQEAGIDSTIRGPAFEAGPQDSLVLEAMKARAEGTRDVTQGTRFSTYDPDRTAAGGPAREFIGLPTAKPEWMKIEGKNKEYYGYDEVLKVINTLQSGKLPRTSRQGAIADQIVWSLKFDAENERATAGGWMAGVDTANRTALEQVERDTAIEQQLFGEIDRIAHEEDLTNPPSDQSVVLFSRPPRAVLHQGFDEALIEQAMQVQGTTRDPYSTLFIARDGVQIAGEPGQEHGKRATVIMRGESAEWFPRDLGDFMLQTGFIRTESTHAHSFATLPSSDQVRSIVRMARQVDPNLKIILDAEDLRFPDPFKLLATAEVDSNVESVNAFLERVADLHRSLGLLDRGEGQASDVAYMQARKRALASIDPAEFDVARYQRIYDGATRLADASDLRILDTGDAFGSEIKALAKHPVTNRWAKAVSTTYQKIASILTEDMPEAVDVTFDGLSLGKEYLGLYLHGPMIDPTLSGKIYVNPVTLAYTLEKQIQNGDIAPADGPRQFAQQTVATLIHEITHPFAPEHSEKFAGQITWNIGRVIGEVGQIADTLARTGDADAAYRYFLGHYPVFNLAWSKRPNLLGPITSGLAAPSADPTGEGLVAGGADPRVRPLPDLLRSGQVPTRRVGSRTPVPRRGTLRPEQSDALESALDRATFDTRLTPRKEEGHAGRIEKGRLIAYHVTDDPEIAIAQFKGGTRPDATRQGGDYGGGLYSSLIPQIWKGRGHQGVYESIGKMSPPERVAFVEAFRAENQHTFSPGYLTQSEIDRVNRNLELFASKGGEQFIATIAGQPYNMDPERALKAIGAGYKASATVDVEMQGKFLDWGAMSSEQTKSLQAAAHNWLTEEGYYDNHEKITPKGLAVIRQFGNERDLTNEYLRALGYDGAVQPGSMMGPLGQTVVWNLDAIRRFGDWHNSRPSPGVAGEGSYYPPKQGEVRLFSPDGVTFTANPELAREGVNRRDPNARIRFVDVPSEIGTQTLAPLPPDLAAKARPLWSRTQDLSAIDPLAPLDPWGSKAEDTEPFTPQRDKMRALWRQFDEGSVPFEEHGKRAQDIRRETAMGITRLNPMIVGTTLTDGKSYVLIHEGASAKEPVRLTRFDKDGLSGHEVYQTPTLALVNAIRDGYLDLAPPNTMDRVMSSPGGQRSTDFQAVRDFTNELTYNQSPVWATFIKLPFPIQLKVVTDPNWSDRRETIRAGQVPQEIAQYVPPEPVSRLGPPEQLILTPPAMRPPVKPAAKQTELFPAAAVSRRMPTERLRPTRPQAQGDLLANLRPPVTNAPDIFEPHPPPPKKTDPGVELGFFLGVPRMSRPQREALVKSVRSLLYGEGQSFSGRNAKERAMTPGERMEHSRKRFYFARFSTEGFLQALGSPAAMEMRNAAINAQANEYGWNADMWRGMDKLQKKYKANLPEIEAALKDITKPVPGHIREAVDAFLRILHPDTGIIPVTTRDMGILGYTGEGGHTGEPRPFTPRRVDLMPRVYKDGYLEKVMTPGTKERAEAIAYVLQTGQVRPLNPADGEQMAAETLDRALSKHIGERQSGGSARDSWAPGLTEAREIDLPDYIHNPFTAVAVRVGQASRKWAIRKQFGKGFSNVFGDEDAGTSGWLDQIQDTHGEMARAAAEYLFDIAYGGHYDGGMTGKVLGTIRNYESMTKLPLAIVQNMGQNTLAGMEVGIRPWMQATAERAGLLGPGGRRRALNAAESAGVLFRQSLRDMETQAGMMAASPLARLTGTVLRSWSWSESLVNRSIAPRTAEIAFTRLDAKLRRGGQLSNGDKGALRGVGLDPAAVQQAGHLSPEAIRNAAWRVTDNTQYFERPTAIPGMFDARGPWGELGPFLFQWKSFSVRLQRWMWHSALKEAGRGNWAPLARFALVAPFVGELIALSRSILGNREREGLDEVASRLMDNPGMDTGLDVAWHLIKNSTEAYGLGMTAQILESFGYGDTAIIKSLAGPGASQGFGLVTGLGRGIKLGYAAYGGTQQDVDALAKWFRDAGRAATKEIPLVGRPFGSRPMVFTEAELLNRMAADEQKALSQAAGYRAKSLRSQGADVDYYLKKELKTIEEINRKYQSVEGRIPLTGPSREAIRSNLERIDQEAGERARQRVPKRLRGAYPEKMSQIPQPPPALFKMAAQVEQDTLTTHLASVPPERRAQMQALLTIINGRRIG